MVVTCESQHLLPASFYQAALDSLQAQIAIISPDGRVLAANASWKNSVDAAFPFPDATRDKLNISLDVVADSAAFEGRPDLQAVIAGIRSVANQSVEQFYKEFPGAGPAAKKWFSIQVTRFLVDSSVSIVLMLEDITSQKLVELQLIEKKLLLELQAATDELTGIPNRRGLDRTLEQEWKRNERTQTPLTAAILDVDHFKRYNDLFGHLAGDECLQRVADVIRSHMRRAGDFAARFGGEEFVLLLPNTPGKGAEIVLQSILNAVRKLAIRHPGTSVESRLLTVSIGYSTMVPARKVSADTLLHQADRALYAAKTNGRDQIVCFEE